MKTLLEMKQASDSESLISLAEAGEKKSIESLKNAISWYSRLVKLYPSCGDAWGDLSQAVHRLTVLTRPDGASSNAERLLEKGLSIQPDSANLWFAMGVHATKTNVQEYALSRALELDPNCIEAWTALARLYFSHSQPEGANEALMKARIRDPSSPTVWEGAASLWLCCYKDYV